MASYFVLNKPPGCITARRDYLERPTVYDHVPPHYPGLPHVERLDYNSEGLLLFTDDGRLAQGLLNPGFREARAAADGAPAGAVDKVYRVKVRGRLACDDPRLDELALPLLHPDDGVLTRPARVRFLELRTRATWVEVILREGRSRQIRHLCARSGLQVVKLRRVQLGPLTLGGLRLRWCRQLGEPEVRACYELALPGERRPQRDVFDDSPAALAAARALRDEGATAGPLTEVSGRPGTPTRR